MGGGGSDKGLYCNWNDGCCIHSSGKSLVTCHQQAYTNLSECILTDRRYLSGNSMVIYVIWNNLFTIRCNSTFVHVKLTPYAKECKLPLAYCVTMTQTSNSDWLFLYL